MNHTDTFSGPDEADHSVKFPYTLTSPGSKSVDKSHIELNDPLDGEMSYDDVFSLVKKSVKKITGRERSGLGLALSDLPPALGAFWQVGGNYIVMNEALILAMKMIAKTKVEFNSFVFTIMAHEYLHSVGFIDESEARVMTAKVSREYFGETHPVSVMSDGDLWSLYPQLRYVKGGDGSILRIVNKFDTDSTSYIA